MATIQESPCPSCGAGPGTLDVTTELAARHPTAASVAGAQVKTTASYVPVLTCTACGLRTRGRFHANGRHVSFDPPGHKGV